MNRHAGRLILMACCLGLISTTEAASGKREKRARRAKEAAKVRRYPDTPWEKAYTFKSKYYDVKTNTAPEVAEYIGSLMDYAQKNYRKIFGFEGKCPRIVINAYRADEEYNAAVGEGLKNSAGLYRTRNGTSTIYTRYCERYRGTTLPTEILLHEGTHQFVDMALNMKVPQAYRDRRPFSEIADGTVRSVPRWLNEGLATYFEVSYYDGKRLVVGTVNKDRLRDLKRRIKDGSLLPLQDLFKPRSAEEFMADDCYEPAWGLTYWFLHDRKKSKAKKKRKIYQKLLRACQRGFFAEPEAGFKKHFYDENGHWRKGAWKRWRRHVQEESFKTLVELTVKDPEKFPVWEKKWHEWILKLKLSDPWGGLKK